MHLKNVVKPEYVFRPTQLLRRLLHSVSAPASYRTSTRFPWGWPIHIDATEEHGKALLHLGIYDLAVSETLWRLCDPGETALDIGANIGCLTAPLAKRIGNSGRVVCFEAHPDIAAELKLNTTTWESMSDSAKITVVACAVSDMAGTIQFEPATDSFAANRGLGRVISHGEGTMPCVSTITVPCITLDEYLSEMGPIGVAKLDVEGHEAAVLRGCRELFATGRIRDWVFEHHSEYPSSVTEMLEAVGYHVFHITKEFYKPALVEAAIKVKRSTWMPHSCVATRDPQRARERMRDVGWKTLR